jgi:N-methylhydantoinase A/oxoprolinase/acetone carboxylase beta subunit
MKHIWIGIDTGGTFADLVLAQLTTGTYHDHQLPTTTTDPAVVLGQSSTGIHDRSSATCARNAFPLLPPCLGGTGAPGLSGAFQPRCR